MKKQRSYPTECMLCAQKLSQVTFHDAEVLDKFMSGQHKILPRRKTGTCAKHQRVIAREIKRGRELGVLGYRGQ